MKVFSNRCPRCRQGLIFRGLVSMNKSCSQCGLKYEREQGYFIGATFLNYMFLSCSTIPTILFFAYLGHIATGGGMAVFQILFFAPFAFRFSRLAWINLDAHTIDR